MSQKLLFGNDSIFLREAVSTNGYLSSLANSSDVKEGTLVHTDFQTSGRGERGNSWESEDGKNILISYIINPNSIEASSQFIISKIAAIAVARTVVEAIDRVDSSLNIRNRVKVKWPNDIYIDDKKAAGILIENTLQGPNIGTSIIGIGLNINQIEFISDAPNPISLASVLGKELNREEVIETLSNNFTELYSYLTDGDEGQVDSIYLDNLYRLNSAEQYTDSDGAFSGEIRGVDNYGRLIIDNLRDKREVCYDFKEVKFIIE